MKSPGPKSLRILGARENNLKNLNLELPHDRLTVVTGLSGSGKSSLAFDTVFAEGQRRYIETFSPYTRQFFDKVKKPDADSILNVRPAIAIQQRTRVTSSRSTVGSMTNINDLLKTLWSNISKPVCPSCGIKMPRYSAPELAELLEKWQALKPGRLFLISAVISLETGAPAPSKKSRSKKAKKVSSASAGPKLEETISELVALGFSRFLDAKSGKVLTAEDGEIPILLSNNRLLVVLDRIRSSDSSSPAQKKRLSESIEQAYQLSAHRFASGARALERCVVAELSSAEGQQRSRGAFRIINGPVQSTFPALPFEVHEFGPAYFCPSSPLKIAAPRPALFSFNHPSGACPDCKGFGKILTVDENLCVPNPMLSLEEKALQCWAGPAARIEHRDLLRFCEANKIPTDKPWRSLSPQHRDLIFKSKSKDFWGVEAWFKWLERKAYKMHVRVFLSRYRSPRDCPVCQGSRLKPDALAYQVSGFTLPQLWAMPLEGLLRFLERERDLLKSSGKLPRALRELFQALLSRIEFLVNLGLPYLTLDRQARTLSGGETQRVNLGAALGSDLVSTHFVLDEPSVGLHARDTGRLINAVRTLTDKGNSLLVVEHDLDFIESADEIVELGPAAGAEGGQITYSGNRSAWPGIPVAVDAAFDNPSPPPTKTRALKISNAAARNLKRLTLEIPLERFVCLTGVSGSGKSTLVNEVLVKAYERFRIKLEDPSTENLVRGFEDLREVLLIDQAPLAKSPRANIATYSGIWEVVRSLLAETEDGLTRALTKSSFSFNVDGGRCPECKGAGFIREDMQFLSDVYIPCEVCLGKRFQPSVLEVRYKGKEVNELLAMSISDAEKFFDSHESIRLACKILGELGLGHLTLGHPLSELSGGEAQRLKLVPVIQASEEHRAEGSKGSLLIFDEPTTGLHYRDILKLIKLLRYLCDQGHSVLCVEHNLTLIAAADWLIDLGPEGGQAGGSLIGMGTPVSFCKAPLATRSSTGKHLKAYVERYRSQKQRTSKGPLTKEALPEAPRALQIRGAREHNLKDVSLDVPLRTFVAITGVSGSGKSTIAKDIIYAEGQRRYLDCLSPYARQFIKELKKPEIDDIKNITPTICVYQHTFQPSKLSTVATMSEIYNFLRLLYAKTGVQHCPDHPEHRITPLSAEDIARLIKKLPETSIRLLAPVIKGKKGNHRAVLERAQASEISQVRIDGVFLSPSTVSMGGGLGKSKVHNIDFVVGKFNPRQLDQELLTSAVSQALSLGGGTLVVHTEKTETIFSTERTCPVCARGFFKPDPEDLSFSSRRGRCSHCEGTGLEPSEPKRSRGAGTCSDCGGARIRELGRHLRLNGLAIYELTAKNAPELREFLAGLDLSPLQTPLAEPVLKELSAKIDTLEAVGLDYLRLDRDCSTLSSGELQRLRLATAMASTLSGAMYIFDEPSAGLHPLDNQKVLERLRTLLANDNSILMIEHDSDSIRASDYIIDVGPGGGREGGEIVYEGPTSDFVASGLSTTAECLRSEISAPAETAQEDSRKDQPRKKASVDWLQVQHGNANNIDDLSIKIPLGKLVSVAGVSGAGKSSFVHGIISRILREGTAKGLTWTLKDSSLTTSLAIERVLEIDQKPIGINSRSTPASYLKIFDDLRNLFAETNEARARGWKAGFFSHNSGKGRCPECKGLGFVRLEMSFLPDAEVRCETCQGFRYADEALAVRYLGLTISQVLNLTFAEAKSVFANHRRTHQTLHLACELGLGYLTLGQSSATLSGGESQRLKLVSELAGSRRGHTLYILDEPTTGLHKSDVARLVRTLEELVHKGNSVLVIEHDRDVLLASQHVVEFGPGAGDTGGKVIFQGAPQLWTKANTPWGNLLATSAPNAPRVKPIAQAAHS